MGTKKIAQCCKIVQKVQLFSILLYVEIEGSPITKKSRLISSFDDGYFKKIHRNVYLSSMWFICIAFVIYIQYQTLNFLLKTLLIMRKKIIFIFRIPPV